VEWPIAPRPELPTRFRWPWNDSFARLASSSVGIHCTIYREYARSATSASRKGCSSPILMPPSLQLWRRMKLSDGCGSPNTSFFLLRGRSVAKWQFVKLFHARGCSRWKHGFHAAGISTIIAISSNHGFSRRRPSCRRIQDTHEPCNG
jgi:hypothetical protein